MRHKDTVLDRDEIERCIRCYFRASGTGKKHSLRNALQVLNALGCPVLSVRKNSVVVAPNDGGSITLNTRQLWDDVYPDRTGSMLLAAMLTAYILYLVSTVVAPLILPDAHSVQLSLAEWFSEGNMFWRGLVVLNLAAIPGCLVWVFWRLLSRVLTTLISRDAKERPHAA